MTIQIKVKTRQKISKLECDGNNQYSALVKALPSKNQANLEIIDLVSEYFNVSKNKVRIKLGKYSHTKIISIDEQIILI
jgi:uncharacterized protein YggU (UPF0235/DUF167 family)